GVHRLERARGAPRASHRRARAARAGAVDASDGAGGERGGQSGARARGRLKESQDKVGACSVPRAPAEEARLSIEPIAPLAEFTAVPSGCPAFSPVANAPTLPARAPRGEKSLRSTALAWASSRAMPSSWTMNATAAAALTSASLCCSGWLKAPCRSGLYR